MRFAKNNHPYIRIYIFYIHFEIMANDENVNQTLSKKKQKSGILIHFITLKSKYFKFEA